jgi:hypothetical protein
MVRRIRGHCHIIAAAAALVLVASAVSTHAAGVSGRAFAVYVNIPNAGISDQYYVDTGWIPTGGGQSELTEASLNVPSLVTSGELGAGSWGDGCRGDSDYAVSYGVLLPGDPAEITFTSIHGRDRDECCDDPDAPYAAAIEGLTFGGQPVAVTGAYDQTVVIDGVGTLIINHHRRGGGGWGGGGGGDDDDEECGDDDDHWVTALHLTLEGGGEVIAGGAYFHSHDHCCAVSTSTSTWGAIKALYR